ncbi:hypothetical protein BT96DRAFT_986978 [Gymnopus androsaceus JB14]|uniref:CoA-dependent acyltransferase n=1 Tax=Gymnopus androsaceus JB14 TaxID=1447944 RepID=A0A6A4I8U2_9AGAR|nr:hypothetical protein BT96DRAFT_986978 [Gymnopus androsaceus JB14]
MIVPVELDFKSITSGSPQQDVDVANYDLWMTFIKNVHDIPEALNIDKFKLALSKALAIYRHACGRLSKDMNGDGMLLWKIRLTDSPIPVEIVHLDHLPQFTDSVIQDDLLLFLPDMNSNIVNADQPLLGLKLHISTQRTIIGVAWHHTLGDAATFLRFMITLSGCYQDYGPDHISPPSFHKHRFPNPSPTDIPEWLPHMSHLAHTYPASEIGAKYTEGNEVVHPIRVIVRRSDAEVLRRKVQAMQDSNSQLKISIHDCLAACFITAINSIQTNAVRRFTNVAGFRQIEAEWNEPNVAGNSIYIISTEFDPNHLLDLGYISAKIRETLGAARRPGFIASYVSVAGHLMMLAADKEEHFFFGSDHNTLSMNSNAVLDWQAVSFGSPSARFFTSGITRFYLRVYPANPTSDSGKGDALDITFGAPTSMRQGIIEHLGPEFLVVE